MVEYLITAAFVVCALIWVVYLAIGLGWLISGIGLALYHGISGLIGLFKRGPK